MCDVLPIYENLAGIGNYRPRNRIQQRGFPAPVSADDGHKITRFNLQRNIVQSCFMVFGIQILIEDFGEIHDLKHCSSLPSF